MVQGSGFRFLGFKAIGLRNNFRILGVKRV